MKRYNLDGVYVCFSGPILCENPKGGWVKWEDAEERVRESYKEGYFMGQNSKWIACTCDTLPCTCGAGIGLIQLGQECDCLKMAKDPQQLCWICPAHGYKKR